VGILLFQCIYSLKVKPATHEEQSKADFILALSFGFHKDSAGNSNVKLAHIADQLSAKYHIPVIAQHEIAGCLAQPALFTVREHRKKGEYLDTFEVISQSIPVCTKHAFTNPIIVAHPAHQWRVMKVVEKFGFEPIAANVSSVPYDRESEQLWTKNKVLFRIYDTIARGVYWWKGYI
jgi:hypothetical protein